MKTRSCIFLPVHSILIVLLFPIEIIYIFIYRNAKSTFFILHILVRSTDGNHLHPAPLADGLRLSVMGG